MVFTRGAVGENGTSTAHNVGQPINNASQFDPAKYILPLPSNKTSSLAGVEGEKANVTVSHNKTILSTSPTASRKDLQQNPKYILPIPSKNATAPSLATEGARVEGAPSAASSSSASIPESPSSASIESVSGFVKTQGQNFVVNGKAAYFAGTDAW